MGYDGQFYQLIAHDPLLARHYDRYIDAPRLRYRRILVPGLAHLLAAGRSAWIDQTYFTVSLLFVGLGVFAMAQLATREQRSTLWGLLFLIAPATLTTLERMTVDASLAALSLSSLLAARAQRWFLLWLSLAGSALSKETGLLVPVAVMVWLVRQKKLRLAAVLSSSILPVAAWDIFVQTHTTGEYSTSDFHFITAYFASVATPLNPGFMPIAFGAATVAAVVAILWASVRSIHLAMRDRFHDLALLLCLCYSIIVLVFQNSGIWIEPNGFARVYSPLLLCLLAATWRQGSVQSLIAFLVASFPTAIQSGVPLAERLFRRP
jgi:hypothetical protein